MSTINHIAPEAVSFDAEREEELRARFAPERVGELAARFLEEGTPRNLRSLAGDRQFVVAYIPAASEYADVPRSVETSVFSNFFEESLTEVHDKYGGKYDPHSTLATVIDVSQQTPVAAGALRIVDYEPTVGFKDIDGLTANVPKNPWLNEIKQGYFAPDEPYDPVVAWERLTARVNNGVPISLAESQDISTHASGDAYRGAHGGLDGVSILFFHACLRQALAKDIKNLAAIFDEKPFENMQGLGEPFNSYPDLGRHPYDGPGDTVPALAIIKNSLTRMRAFDEGIYRAFVYGDGLDNALLPSEYDPETYSDEAIGIVE